MEGLDTTPLLEESPATRAAARSHYVGWVLAVAAVVVVVLGFCGLDRAFYQEVSCRLETKDRLFDRDFYSVTRPFWWACRFAFAHVLGGATVYIAIAALHPRRWRAANAAAVAVIAAALVANGAQSAIGRLRPNQADLAERGLKSEHKSGFPSGEATTALALATVLSRAWPRWRAAFYACGTLAAVSRLVNGAHYVSDVVAGALWGAVCAGFVYDHADWAYAHLRAAFQRAKQT